MPDPEHPEGGTFYIANQGFALRPAEDPSVIVEVVAPLRSGSDGDRTARITRALHLGVIDIAGFHYDVGADRILMVSDSANALFEVTRGGEVLRGWAFPGNDQEGIAIDPCGFIYIAQDSGWILKLRWLR